MKPVLLWTQISVKRVLARENTGAGGALVSVVHASGGERAGQTGGGGASAGHFHSEALGACPPALHVGRPRPLFPRLHDKVASLPDVAPPRHRKPSLR